MLGKPKFDYNDKVKFKIIEENDKEIELIGTVAIIDAYGTFGQNKEVSYDIMVDSKSGNWPILYKHIVESLVERIE